MGASSLTVLACTRQRGPEAHLEPLTVSECLCSWQAAVMQATGSAHGGAHLCVGGVSEATRALQLCLQPPRRLLALRALCMQHAPARHVTPHTALAPANMSKDEQCARAPCRKLQGKAARLHAIRPHTHAQTDSLTAWQQAAARSTYRATGRGSQARAEQADPAPALTPPAPPAALSRPRRCSPRPDKEPK